MNILLARDLLMVLFAALIGKYDVILLQQEDGKTLVVHKGSEDWQQKMLQDAVEGEIGKWRYPTLYGFTTSSSFNETCKRIGKIFGVSRIEDFR